MTLVLPHPALWFGGRQYAGDGIRGDATSVARGPRASSRRAAATEDVALVQAIRRDEPGALETLYRSYFERLLRYAYQIVRDDDVAQSLVQDVFVALWERRNTWRMSGSLDSYLYRAIRNRAWNAMRDDRRRVRLRTRAVTESGHSPGMASASPNAAERLEQEELDALIKRALAALPARQYEALALRWSHQLRYADIARIMNVSESRIRQLVTRAEQQVRDTVAEYVGKHTP